MTFGDKLKTTLTGITIWGIATQSVYGFTNQIKDAITYVNDLDKSMTNIEMITDVSQQKAQQLVSQYRELAQQLGQNDTDFLKGAEDSLRAGLSDSDTKEMLKQTAIGASISGDTNQEMQENLQTMKDSYNLTVNEIGNLVDKLSTLDNKSSTSFDGIIEGMKRSAASAQQVGVQYDKLAAYITTVESVSHKSASTIGESFKSIFSRMTSMSAGKTEDDLGINDVEKTLTKQGITLRETSGQWRNMGDVIDDIGKRWKSFDSVTQSQISTVVAGKQQMSSFLTLMQNYDKEQQYEVDQQSAQGSAWKKYQDYLNSTEAKVNSFKTSLHTLYSDLANSTTINQAISNGQGFVQFLDYITTQNPIAGAGIGALSTAFIGLAAAMKTGVYASFLKQISEFKIAFAADAVEMGAMTTASTLLSVGLTGVATAGKAAMLALIENPLT
jgi:TP901 family phage tail tape measure protein